MPKSSDFPEMAKKGLGQRSKMSQQPWSLSIFISLFVHLSGSPVDAKTEVEHVKAALVADSGPFLCAPLWQPCGGQDRGQKCQSSSGGRFWSFENIHYFCALLWQPCGCQDRCQNVKAALVADPGPFFVCTSLAALWRPGQMPNMSKHVWLHILVPLLLYCCAR